MAMIMKSLRMFIVRYICHQMYKVLFVIPLLRAGLAFGGQLVNPLLNTTLENPGIVKHKGLYYVVLTENVASQPLPIYESPDLQTWEVKGYVFNMDNAPTWAIKSAWYRAPEIHVLDDSNFIIYFQTIEELSKNNVIGVASSTNILGPYTTTKAPIVRNESQHLAGPTFLRADNEFYLFWAGFWDGVIYAHKLTSDGLNVLDNDTYSVLTPSLTWETRYLEAPSVVQKDGFFYIFYSPLSAGHDCSAMGIGVARASHPLGPYEKHGEPILLTSEKMIAPIEPTVVKHLDDDNDLLVFQAYTNSEDCYHPFLWAVPLDWDENDWPVTTN